MEAFEMSWFSFYCTWEHVDEFHSLTVVKVLMEVCEVSMYDNNRVFSFVVHYAVANLIFGYCKQTRKCTSRKLKKHKCNTV